VSLILSRPSSSFLAASRCDVRDREPDGAEKYQADAGTVRRDRGVPPDRHVRDAAPDGHRRVQSPVVDGRQQAHPLSATRLYWGQKAKLARIIIVPIGGRGARLQALPER
jgi:hypothetical protein